MKKVSAEALAYGWSKCRGCNRVLSLPLFGLIETGEGNERHLHCFDCRTEMRATKAKYRRKYPQTVNRGPAYMRNCAIIAEAKSSPCVDCRRLFPACCMDFDHRPGCDKVTEVATLRSVSEQTLRDEIAKCDLVCCCCHRIRTAARKYAGSGRPFVKKL